MIKKTFKILLLITAVLAAAGCAPVEKRIETKNLELSLKNILELPAYEQIYRDIVYVGEQRKVLFFTTSDKEVLFSIDIRVQAGIRNAGLIELEITGTAEDGRKVAAVSVPRAEILLVDADESSIEQYFIKEKGDVISRLEYYDEINRKKEELVNYAISKGLLKQADINAQQLIRSFLELSNIVVGEFREISHEQ